MDENKVIPKLDPKMPDMLVGMTELEAKESCTKSDYNLIVTKSDGRWVTQEGWERKGKYVCVHTENNKVVAVEDKNGNTVSYGGSPTTSEESDSSEKKQDE